jgi:holo-[acyl-carrier protein] synthase
VNVIGIGVDVVEVQRMERVLARHPRFVARVYAKEEADYCLSQAFPAPCFAARWAAKEACVKALGGIPEGRWRDIRVVRGDDGAVSIDLVGTAKARAQEIGAERVLVSVAHERSVAVAYCLAVAP